MPYAGTPLSGQWERINRRREIARRMIDAATAPNETRMVSGHAVPQGIGEGLTKLASSYIGSRASRKADEDLSGVADVYHERGADALKSAMKTAAGRPEESYKLSEGERFGSETIPGLKTAAVPGDPLKAAGEIAASPYLSKNKAAQGVAGAMLNKSLGSGKSYYTRRPMSKGFDVFDTRSGVSEFRPYTEEQGLPIKEDPYHQRDLKYHQQIGTGTGELETDPPTKRATTQAEQDVKLETEPEIKRQTVAAGLEAETAHQRKIERPEVDSTMAVQQAELQNVLPLFDKAIANAGAWTTGLMSQVLGGIGGTPQHDLQQTLLSIRAATGLDRLLELKKAGGYLGQVTEAEHKLLQGDIRSLEGSQSDEQLKDNLFTLKQHHIDAWNRVKVAYEKTYGVPYTGQGVTPVAPSGSIFDQADAILGQ